ncbi:cytochrome c biogenesis CcdA family protein [Marivita sp. S2033]|uniref:cytochrome c biogenesis CcdA family protein n=1 Tax=Marivita sp. S2033 TaxID=3373187 RepID=UPI0039828F32
MFDISFAGAALAGILSFFTPCILPMVPFYLCYMAGISMNELKGEEDVPQGVAWNLVASACLFALGVTTIFVLLGMGATAVGQAFADYREPLRYVAAVVLAAFGLHFLGIVRIPILYREAKVEAKTEPTTWIGAYVMGLAFGFGWTPCVGPALASILMIAGGMGDVVQGGLLLFVYGVGMTFPFVIAALFSGPFLRWTARNRGLLHYAEKAMGGMLIVFAILIATDTINLIANAMLEWFPNWSSLG